MVKKMKKVAFDSKVFLATVNRGRTISNYRKDEVIFSQADPADAVFYVQRGKVKIVVTSEEGKEAIIAILGRGEFFGERMLDRASAAPSGCHGHDGERGDASGKSGNDSRPP